MGGPTRDEDEPRPAGDDPAEPSDADVDARWAEITARLGRLVPDDDVPLRDADETSAAPGLGAGPRDRPSSEEDEEDRYVPPDPTPLDGSDPLTTMSWVAAVGGPLLTILLLVVWPGAPSTVYGGILVASAVGWVTLLLRMPRERSDDDGAVV